MHTYTLTIWSTDCLYTDNSCTLQRGRLNDGDTNLEAGDTVLDDMRVKRQEEDGDNTDDTDSDSTTRATSTGTRTTGTGTRTTHATSTEAHTTGTGTHTTGMLVH